MNPVVKPWPFRGWAMDLIGKIYPASSQQHCFIIVATDYFTEWVEAKPIIQRFGIPESITTDRGSSFISGEMLDMAEAFKIRRLQSTPYYAQANGQTESSNKNCSQAILLELEGLDASRIDTLNKLLAGKQVVSRAYNKRVKNKSFEEGEIVWKAILPLGTHVAGCGKWSRTWEGPFIINQILGMGAYRLQDRDGEIHAAPINGKWLKKFYPTM
ncbi:unnamed protein product [Prunus armeniaca]